MHLHISNQRDVELKSALSCVGVDLHAVRCGFNDATRDVLRTKAWRCLWTQGWEGGIPTRPQYDVRFNLPYRCVFLVEGEVGEEWGWAEIVGLTRAGVGRAASDFDGSRKGGVSRSVCSNKPGYIPEKNAGTFGWLSVCFAYYFDRVLFPT